MSNLCQNNFKWVNTEVEFKWDPELQRYVEVYSDGYCYDGEWALAGQSVGGGPPGVTPGGVTPGGGPPAAPPTFSFRAPHAYDINDGIYGLGVTDADGNPFEKIPAVLNYEEHHYLIDNNSDIIISYCQVLYVLNPRQENQDLNK